MQTRRRSPSEPIEQSSKELIQDHEVFINNLCEDAPYPLFVIGPDTSIKYVNPAFEELTGYTLKELTGCKPPYPWWSGDKSKRTRELKTVVLSGESRIERRNIKKNGDFFWVQVSGKPVYINGELKYFLSNWVDITKRKKAEQQLSKLNKDLRNLTAHMDSIREEERANISRMLHDELGQALTALKMDVCWIRKGLDGNQRPLTDTTDSMLKLIDATIKKVRWISTVLRPTWLDDLGLADTLKWLVEEFQEMTDIKCKISISENLNLDKQLSTAIYRIFQESLTNIFHHSKATQVSVQLRNKDNKACLIVSDNGVGISQKNMSSPRSYGIMGMRERAQFLGGTFDITSTKNKGTTITVIIPM